MENIGKDKKMKGKLKKALIIILVIVGILVLTVLGLGIYFIVTKPKADISEIPQNLGLSVILSDVVSATSEDEENLNWYAALDEAGADTSLIEDSAFYGGYDTSKRITSFEGDDQCMAVNAYVNPKNENNDFVSFVLYHKREGKYSQPYKIFSTWIDLNNDDTYRYDCDDAAVSLLSLEDALGFAVDTGDGNKVYCGFWADEAETRSLTFAGQELDGVEKVDYFDTPYYFWYITLPDVEGRLQNIDYGSYTCQELIDALKVQYEKAE